MPQKNIKEMTRKEMQSYFRFKDYNGEQMQIVMDAIDYGISAVYMAYFEDTGIPPDIMEIMLAAMKEDYGTKVIAFIKTIDKEENGKVILEGLKTKALEDIQNIYRPDILPAELRKQISNLPSRPGTDSTELTAQIKELLTYINTLKQDMEKQNDSLSSIKEQFRQMAATENKELQALVEQKEIIIRNQSEQIYRLEEENARLMEAKEMPDTDFSYQADFEKQILQSQKDRERLLGELESAKKEIKRLEEEKSELLYPGSTHTKYNTLPKPRKKDLSTSLFRKKRKSLTEQILLSGMEAPQMEQIRLALEDNLTESQLLLLAENKLSVEKLRELREIMKRLNERSKHAHG